MGHSKCTRSAIRLRTGVPFLFLAESAMIQIFGGFQMSRERQNSASRTF